VGKPQFQCKGKMAENYLVQALERAGYRRIKQNPEGVGVDENAVMKEPPYQDALKVDVWVHCNTPEGYKWLPVQLTISGGSGLDAKIKEMQEFRHSIILLSINYDVVRSAGGLGKAQSVKKVVAALEEAIIKQYPKMKHRFTIAQALARKPQI